MSCTGAAGTSPAKCASHAAVVRADSAASSRRVNSARFSSRALKLAKRGSSDHSGRPTFSHSTGQNFCLLHMMKIQPSAVR